MNGNALVFFIYLDQNINNRAVSYVIIRHKADYNWAISKPTDMSVFMLTAAITCVLEMSNRGERTHPCGDPVEDRHTFRQT